MKVSQDAWCEQSQLVLVLAHTEDTLVSYSSVGTGRVPTFRHFGMSQTEASMPFPTHPQLMAAEPPLSSCPVPAELSPIP